jgi:hypothetical protein
MLSLTIQYMVVKGGLYVGGFILYVYILGLTYSWTKLMPRVFSVASVNYRAHQLLLLSYADEKYMTIMFFIFSVSHSMQNCYCLLGLILV